MGGTAGSGGDAGGAHDEALARIGAAERELAELADVVRTALARTRVELARARAAVEELGAPDAPEGARLVALDLVVRGVERQRAERELRAAFPGVDAAGLLARTVAEQGR
ncbi:MAG: hypothetical protein LT070_03145 [Solirubrobacteraceae bacterium]|nr:hypothetical protein [Solirubrobacteraceae bacterium]